MNWKLLILKHVLADRDGLAAQHPLSFQPGEDRVKFAQRRVAVQHARDGIVRLKFREWLDHSPTPAERKAASRAVADLISDGLLLAGEGGRVNFVQLTQNGDQMARQLTEVTA